MGPSPEHQSPHHHCLLLRVISGILVSPHNFLTLVVLTCWNISVCCLRLKNVYTYKEKTYHILILNMYYVRKHRKEDFAVGGFWNSVFLIEQFDGTDSIACCFLARTFYWATKRTLSSSCFSHIATESLNTETRLSTALVMHLSSSSVERCSSLFTRPLRLLLFSRSLSMRVHL